MQPTCNTTNVERYCTVLTYIMANCQFVIGYAREVLTFHYRVSILIIYFSRIMCVYLIFTRTLNH